MATRIVFLDCDGTLTTVKSSWEYLHRRLNLWNGNADEYQTLFRQGVIDYREFCRRDALLWRGLSVGDLKSMIGEIPYQPGAKDLVASLKGAGIITVIVSTGLSFLVEKVRGELSIDLSFSNDLLYRDGRLSGEISINVDHDLKGPVVRRTLERLRLSPAEASAIGLDVAAQVVDGAVFGGGHQPGAGVVGQPRGRPALERGDQGVLGQLLGQVQVAHHAHQGRDHLRRFVAPSGGDGVLEVRVAHGRA
mgnify:CR=1 FL=1